MPNKKNIEPYAQMVKNAAKGGGPEKYLEKFAEANREIGRLEGMKKGFAKGVIVTLTGVASFICIVVPTIKLARDRLLLKKNEERAKLEELQKISDDAMEEYLSEFEQIEGGESEKKTIEDESSD